MAVNYNPMVYFIEDIPEGQRVIDKFPDLMSKEELFMREDDLPEGVDADKVLRYLIYMFSPNTPLRTDIPDFNQRKNFALKKINVIADASGSIPDGYSKMCMMNEEWIISRFVMFTRFFHSVAYEKLAIAEQRNSQLAEFILSTTVEKAGEDKKLREDRKGWYQDIDEALKSIMDGETSSKLAEGIVFRVKMENLGIRPEEYTRFFMENGYVFPEIIP